MRLNYLVHYIKIYTLKKKNNFKTYGVYFKYLPSIGQKIYENFNHIVTKNLIKNFNPNIIHETYYSEKKYNSDIKVICTVYDLINEIFPNNSKNSKKITELKKITLNRADKIISISHKTKEDLVKYLNIDENKIEVTHLSSGIRSIQNPLFENKKFPNHLLFVGSRNGYKNFKNFIKAFGKSKYLNQNFKIICYGGEKFSRDEKDFLKNCGISKSKILHYNDDDYELSYLYANVCALVYPSLYEGFGIPVLEAMSSKCPIILSNGGALKEVGGKGLDYFNPQDIDDMTFVLEKILNSNSSLNEKIEYGYKRSKEFSWKKCANETLKIYNSI